MMLLLHLGEFSSLTHSPDLSHESCEFILRLFFSSPSRQWIADELLDNINPHKREVYIK